MRIPAFILLIAAAAATLVLSGCLVYQHVPRQDYTPAQLRWSDSVSSVREAELAALLIADRGQRRSGMTRNALLDSVARARALDMATRGYFAHVNPDGLGANTLVRRAGYRLPASYATVDAGYNIESAAAGYPYASARAAWRGWMGSPGHRAHLLGLHPAFAAQTEFGIGYVYRPDSRKGHYWVVLIAPPPEP
ncbi:MAG TPA: CAP domain-containing protein [Longimicrobium sp.]|nr:CAP domain-containing protein [Longimicrobium sp.]